MSIPPLRGLAGALVLLLLMAGASGAAPRLSVPGVLGFPGATVGVPINFRVDTNDPGSVVALQADVQFDPGNIDAANPTTGSALRNQVFAFSQPSNGVRRVLVYSYNKAPLTNGIVASLPFTVSTGARGASFPVTLKNVVLASANATLVAANVASGYISINPVFVRADGDVDVFFKSTAGYTYIVQATTNFVTWVNILTNTVTSDIFTFTDADAHLYRYRFYRVVPYEPPLHLADPAWQANGAFSFDLLGTGGRTYIIQASTNLHNWVSISTNYSATDIISFADADAPRFRYRFYRALLFDGFSGGRIGTITRLPGGQAAFNFGGIAGRTYTVQASTNLAQWINLTTVVATNGTINYVDPNAANFPFRFYRVQLNP